MHLPDYLLVQAFRSRQEAGGVLVNVGGFERLCGHLCLRIDPFKGNSWPEWMEMYAMSLPKHQTHD